MTDAIIWDMLTLAALPHDTTVELVADKDYGWRYHAGCMQRKLSVSTIVTRRMFDARGVKIVAGSGKCMWCQEPLTPRRRRRAHE